jgi:hypothetical protein
LTQECKGLQYELRAIENEGQTLKKAISIQKSMSDDELLVTIARHGKDLAALYKGGH